MRKAAGEQPRIKTDTAEQIARSVARCVRRYTVHLRSKRDRILNGQTWIERRIAVLKHHLHAPAQFPQRKRRADQFAVQ